MVGLTRYVRKGYDTATEMTMTRNGYDDNVLRNTTNGNSTGAMSSQST